MLKTVKKKDSLELLIYANQPTDLRINVVPKENNRVTTSYVKIQNTQNIAIDLPDEYDKPIIVDSSEFQKMCRGLSNISNITRVMVKKSVIIFSTDAGGVMKRSTQFGEIDEDDDEKDDEYRYSEDFNTEQLIKITKISALNKNMQVYVKNDNPILFRSLVGNIGKISIYVKSKKMYEEESRISAESVDD
jgi:hypothetical protein